MHIIDNLRLGGKSNLPRQRARWERRRLPEAPWSGVSHRSLYLHTYLSLSSHRMSSMPSPIMPPGGPLSLIYARVIFPDIDPVPDAIRTPFLSVVRSTYYLRRYVFIPSGIEGGELLTHRSSRYGSHTDALLAGAPEGERITRWLVCEGRR